MDFIYKLLPFLSAKEFAENILTSIWIIGLIIIFIAAGIYLYIHSKAIKKSINSEKLPTNEKLENLWKAYQDTFRSYGDLNRTTEFAETYFHEQNILFASFDLRTINNIPNILVGLGILGTFAGLTYGISDSSFETTEEIKFSIDNLLTGMGTAFVTSIWGMFLSLLYGFVFKRWQSGISIKIQNLCLKLDNKYKIKPYDLEIYKQNEQRKLINGLFNEYLVAETEDGRQLPKNVFRQLLDESVNQTASLRTLADDLSQTIELAMQELIVNNNVQISSLIQDKLVPVLEDLKQIKQDSGTAMIESAVNRLSDAMKFMMDEFKNTIAGDTKKELEGLTQQFGVVKASLTEIPGSMSAITVQVTEIVEALKESVFDNINQSQTQVQEMNKQNQQAFSSAAVEYRETVGELQTQVKEISRQNQEIFSSATTEYKATVEELQKSMEQLLNTQKVNIEHVFDLTDRIDDTLSANGQINQQFETMMEKSKVVVQLIEDVSRKFNENTTSLSDTSNNLKFSVSHFSDSINTYINKNEALLEQHKLTMEIARKTVNEYSDKFGVIESGLTGVFGQIQTGLTEYQTTTREGLNDYLSGFTTSLTNANQGLESAVSGLSEINEELFDQIDKLVSIR